ncbi:MAG: SpoIIE family protein phosphatase, partial [Oscillospiraceae bacterium]
NGRTGKAQCHCLPAGILREVGFDKAVVTIKEDDIILMMSDGVISEGTDWIYAELEAFQDGSAKQLAEHIANAARRRRTDGHSDDITVMAAILDKAI